MNWISTWVQGIIIAVIIGTIIEMLLPEGNCKKYIKVVIGIYILFSVVSPVITKVTGNEFRVSNIFDINTYLETSTNNQQQEYETIQSKQIKQIYETNLKNDMKQKLKEKGYNVKNIYLEIENNEQYTLTYINIQLSKDEETNNQINSITPINITIENQVNNEETTDIALKEKNTLKEYLSGIYNVDTKNISIK